jgi:hypothetical protein
MGIHSGLQVLEVFEAGEFVHGVDKVVEGVLAPMRPTSKLYLENLFEFLESLAPKSGEGERDGVLDRCHHAAGVEAHP